MTTDMGIQFHICDFVCCSVFGLMVPVRMVATIVCVCVCVSAKKTAVMILDIQAVVPNRMWLSVWW